MVPKGLEVALQLGEVRKWIDPGVTTFNEAAPLRATDGESK